MPVCLFLKGLYRVQVPGPGSRPSPLALTHKRLGRGDYNLPLLGGKQEGLITQTAKRERPVAEVGKELCASTQGRAELHEAGS